MNGPVHVDNPPKALERLLGRTLPAGRIRDSVLGDLAEGYHLRLTRRGRRAARRWYRRQALALLVRYAWERVAGRDLWERRVRKQRTAHGHPDQQEGRLSVVSAILQDLRYGLRTMQRNPGFSLVVVFTLAVGIGANAAIFSVVNTVLLQPLPYHQPESIIQVWGSFPERGWPRFGASFYDLEDWRTESSAFETIAAYNSRQGNLYGGDRPERVNYTMVSPELFDVLGVPPMLGRLLDIEENIQGRDAVVVVSHDFWRTALGSSPDALGRTLVLEGRPMTVVGVMPPGFYFPGPGTQLWKPFGMGIADGGPREGRWVSTVARLAPGYTLQEAQTEMTTVAARMRQAYPEENEGLHVLLERRLDQVVQQSRPLVLILWGATSLILLIACVNVANLLLARATARAREIAVRSSLGAGRRRIIGQLLSESMLYSVFGGLGGSALAAMTMSALRTLAATSIPRTGEITLDGWALAYAGGVALLSGVAFGLAPAWQSSAGDPAGGLRDGRGNASRGSDRTRSLLVVTELALCTLVLISAGLLLRSFWTLQRVDPGFETENRLMARIAPSWEAYPEREQARGFYSDLLQRVVSLPGVTSAAAVNSTPLSGSNQWGASPLHIEGREQPEARPPGTFYRTATPGYFETMAIPLLAGRTLRSSDNADSEPVVVISERVAEIYWPGENAIGRQLSFAPPESPGYRLHTVVGVVPDVRDNRLGRAPNPLTYVSFAQAGWGHFQNWSMAVVVESAGDPESLVESVRRTIESVDERLPAFQVQTIAQLVDGTLAGSRVNALLLVAFAAVALILAGVGIFGVMSYMVGQRTHEIGMRVALGADRHSVLRLVMNRGMALAAAGVAVGSAAALISSRVMDSLLFGVTATDLPTFGTTVALLLAVALASSLIPALRAVNVDPMICLRGD